MNLTKLFETQCKLDERIVKEKGLEGQDLLPMKILALQVELGELANEWRGFKFWSENQLPKPPKHNWRASEDGMNQEWIPEWGYESYPLLEEYVDCLHFILSIGLEINKKEVSFVYNNVESNSNANEIIATFELIFKNTWNVHGDYEFLFNRFKELGELLGFTWEQIESAYYAKNAINHTRQSEGY